MTNGEIWKDIPWTNGLSNADRIRQMTDDELYVFLDTITDCCHGVPKCEKCPMKYRDVTPRCNIKLWLKQEYRDADND